MRVYDTAGRDYIEAMSGLWCTALGWGDEELVEAAAEQMRKLSYGHLFGGKSHEPGRRAGGKVEGDFTLFRWAKFSSPAPAPKPTTPK